MKNNKPRALVIAPTPTWPLDYGNRKRIFMVCQELKARGLEIHYVHYASEGDWRNNMPMNTRFKMDEQWDIVDHVFPSIGLHNWPKKGDDHLIDEWWDPALENHLKHVFNGRTYDVVIVNYTWLSKALELVPQNTFKVLDTHDKFSGRRQVLEKNGIAKEFFHTTEKEEVIGLSRADLVWAIKDEERVAFEAMGVESKIETLLHMDEKRESKSPRSENGYTTFGFIGARNNINKVNIKNFLKVAIPIFEKYLPPLEIHIAGSICKEFDNEENSFIKLLGYVDTVDAFYDGIDAAIVPMEFSTGLKIKAGEALSQSKALISHLHAMEGYPTTHDLHRCESFEEMALAMCELAYEASSLSSLSNASLSSYDICMNSITECLDNLVNYVRQNHNIIILLPKQYGDEKSPIHWFCLAQMEWLSWRFKPVYVSLHKGYFDYHDARVRHMSAVELQELSKFIPNKVIYNLDDCALPMTLLPECNIIDMVSLEHNSEFSFIDTKDKKTLPGFGHIKIPQYEQLCLEHSEGIIVLSKDSSLDVISAFTNLLKTNEKETVDFLKLDNFSNFDTFMKCCTQKSSTMPRLIIVAKQISELTSVEQLFIDMMRAHGVATKSLETLVEFHEITSLSNNHNALKYNYDNSFYNKWLISEVIFKEKIRGID